MKTLLLLCLSCVLYGQMEEDSLKLFPVREIYFYDTTHVDRQIKMLITRCDECVAESIIGFYIPAKSGERRPTYYDKEWKLLDEGITVWDVKRINEYR